MMKILTITEGQLAQALALQLEQWTGTPAETWMRVAEEAWRAELQSGRVQELQTAFGTIRLMARKWMPEDVALVVQG